MRADPIATVAAPMPTPREPIRLTCTWSPWRARVDEGWVRGRAARTYSYPSAFHSYFVSKTQDPFCRGRPESQNTAPSGDFLHTPHLQVPIPGILQADIWLRSLPTWCERQHGTLAMFTKALSALAIILSSVSGAVAVTKHEGTAANRAPANNASAQNPHDKADFVIGNMLFVGFHEMGHALADQFHLPTLGRAEDAADSFATIALLDAGSAFSIHVLVQAARGLFLSDRPRRHQGEALDLPGPAGLDRKHDCRI